MAKALWPSESPPGLMGELAELFKGAHLRFELWKSSACRERARETWATVKTRYTGLDPNLWPGSDLGDQTDKKFRLALCMTK